MNIRSKIKAELLLFLIFWLTGTSLPAQDLSYARQIIDTLTSPSMHGRGYVFKGDSIAAEYIAGEFERHDLKAFGENYFQPFTISINTFPGAMKVTAGENNWKPGKDFIPAAASSGAEGEFPIVRFNVNALSDTGKLDKKYRKQALLIEWDTIITGKEKWKFTDFVTRKIKVPVIIEPVKKLTWAASYRNENILHLKVIDSIIGNPELLDIDIDQEFIEDYATQNAAAFIEGTKEPDSFIVFTAHYDHLGRIGKDVYIPGANDNASGIAMLLNLAAHYAENPPEHSVAFIAFAAEEAGLIGSAYYTSSPLFPLEQINFLLNLDLMGTGSKGITVVNGTVHEKAFQKLTELNKNKDYVAKVKKRGPAANSDHYFFYKAGVPSFFIYTMGGPSHYHDIYDRAKTLPLTEFEDVFRLLRDFVKDL